ncbi:MAG: hypothetical protein ACK5XT_04390 [Gemmatimonas sp.]|uniref:hypothetical protein n=1 Tax=Gemmatimonas sp. TaxID=1962908 RepID=UPI00391F53BA
MGRVRRGRRAGAEVGEDPVDDGRLRDAGDDPHRALARRARERVDLEDLPEERRLPAAGLGWRESGCGHDGGWPVRGGGRRHPLALFATGLLGLAGVARRRRNA